MRCTPTFSASAWPIRTGNGSLTPRTWLSKIDDGIRRRPLEHAPKGHGRSTVDEPFALHEGLDRHERAARVKFAHDERDAFGTQQGRRIADVEVQVRTRGHAPRTADTRDHLAAECPVTGFDGDASLLQMFVKAYRPPPRSRAT